jgi:germination protein M
MSRRAAGWILGLALAVLAAGLAVWWWTGRDSGPGGGSAEEFTDGGVREKVAFDLYFPAANGLLRTERRELEVTAAPRNRVRMLVQALLAGPRQQGLARPFPPEVKVGSVELVDGVAYIDLRWEERAEPPPGGSTEEMQRVYSVVNTVALNVPPAERVALLWNGVQPTTFSGHLDTSQPLPPERAMLAR